MGCNSSKSDSVFTIVKSQNERTKILPMIKNYSSVELTQIANEIQVTFKAGKFSLQYLESKDIREFDYNDYLPLTSLGKGGYGEVLRAQKASDREIVAIKMIECTISEELESTVTIFFHEKMILEKLNSLNSQYLCKYIGSYYMKDKANKLSKLIIITTAGNCNLKELLEIRKAKRTGQPIYEDKELIKIFHDLTVGLKILSDNRIYHSDIKPGNIIVNLSQNTYQLLDFGVSKIIPESSNTVPILQYGTAGTENYFSPEKKKFWSKCAETSLEQNQKQFYDPFKCDIWSMGACFSKIHDPHLNQLEKGKLFIDKMLSENWKNRPSIEDITGMITDFFPNYLNNSSENISQSEKDFIKLIEMKYTETEDIHELETKLRTAHLIEERIDYLEEQLRKHNTAIRSQNQLDNKDDKKITLAFIHHTLGFALEENGEHERAIENFEKSLEIKREIFKNEENEDVAVSLNCMAGSLRSLGKHDKCLEILERALKIRRKIHGTDENEVVANVLNNIATEHSVLGKHSEALREFQNVLSIRKKVLKTDMHGDIAAAHNNIASELKALGKPKEALDQLKSALQIQRSIFQSDLNLSIATTLNNMAVIFNELGDSKYALENFEKVLLTRRKILKNENHPLIVSVKQNIEQTKQSK